VTASAALPDINLRNLIPLDRQLPRPRDLRLAVYRITLRDDPDPGAAFVQDAHQEVGAVQGRTLELHVHPVRHAAGPGPAAPPGDEYRKPSHYLPCEDATVRAVAARAAAGERDPWHKALRMERWVRDNLRVDQTAALVPADRTARDLRGDCRHAALLTTALCRAEGLPARTAIGLLYVERNHRPYLGFHMWTEVWIEGRWLGLDGTPGTAGVGAGHLKVTDHSWHNTASLTPLLPLYRVLGKAAVEVIRFEPGS
jgi:transglutaminase-like putative cysteine protease